MLFRSFGELSLSQYRGKYVLLFFYPLDFTFVCPTEIIAFSDRVGEFSDLGVEVIGVSVDSHYSHLAWRNTPRTQGGIGPVGYPLVADLNKQIARDYDVLLNDAEIAKLPDAANVVYMPGRKFGSTGDEGTTWAINCYLPSLVCKRYSRSKIEIGRAHV